MLSSKSFAKEGGSRDEGLGGKTTDGVQDGTTGDGTTSRTFGKGDPMARGTLTP
jgi:hypothetical protein